MQAIINIDSDDDFYFMHEDGVLINFPVELFCESEKDGKQKIRDWIWEYYSSLCVKNSAERQKDHIKLHKGRRHHEIETQLEKMYRSTYIYIKYCKPNGNWTFSWKIV